MTVIRRSIHRYIESKYAFGSSIKNVESKSNSQSSNSNQNNFEYITPTPGGEIAPCPPSEVPLAGFLLIFQYIAVIIYFF